MEIVQTDLAGVVEVKAAPYLDHRGAFCRLFCADELASILGSRRIVQINHSRTETIGAVRGMHFQSRPAAEMKFVRCLHGRVWDVALDLRRGSPTFLKWHAVELDSSSMRMLVIPEGCAHGFQVLEEGSELLYLHTAFYDPATEGGVRPDDPIAAIHWPLPIRELSVRDQSRPLLGENFEGITP